MAQPRKRAKSKSPEETAGPTLVPQPHGGALLPAGKPGNVGGTGRPPSAIRERLRGSFEQRIAILEEIADDTQAAKPDRMKAVDILAKYGLGTTKELTVEHVRDRLQRTIADIYALLPKEQADALIARIESHWR